MKIHIPKAIETNTPSAIGVIIPAIAPVLSPDLTSWIEVAEVERLLGVAVGRLLGVDVIVPVP
jgi:hypothetical protein